MPTGTSDVQASIPEGAGRRVEVALAEGGRAPSRLTYGVPPSMDADAVAGALAVVPLGTRRVMGVVLGPSTDPAPAGLRPIEKLLPDAAVPAPLLDLAAWAARYYAAPSASLLRSILPPPVRGRRRRVARPLPRVADEHGSSEGPGPGGRATFETRILERLPAGGLDVETLVGEMGKGVPAALRRLAARDLVEVSDVDVERRSAAACYARASDGAGEPSTRARAQRRVWEHVVGRDPHPVTAAEIESRIPGGRRVAEELVRRGLLRRVARDDGGSEEDSAGSRDGGDPAAEGAVARRDVRVALHPEQARAVAAIDDAAGAFAPLLLFGVTGSGKTEVYLRAAEAALARGRSVLLLVPEIGLTHQLVVEASRRFGSATAVLHSGLSESERADAWRDLASGRKRVAIGARSAVFAPLRDLGLVVVDEEHDAAYKQEESPRYQGRDVAVMRAKLEDCPIVLASATPSLESWQAAQDGRYRLVELASRANLSSLPAVEVVDLRVEAFRPEPPGAPSAAAVRRAPLVLSAALERALVETYRAGEQSVLFLNRRGFDRFVQCEACGEVESCPDCSVSLTVHRARRAAVCHHCGHERRPQATCARCGTPLAARSFGTEQVEAAAVALLPAARIARLDRDTAVDAGFVRRTLEAWRDGALDVLVGTQMVAKGHDAPGVTLIGVVLADASLNFPDFRASERTFQLIAQVAGRAGRGSKPGRVLVQTRQPDHPSLVAASAHDFPAFADAELRARRELGYPPFGRLLRFVLEGEADEVERRADRLGERLRRAAVAAGGADGGLQVLGPAPAPIERLRGRHRHQLLVKARDARGIARLLAASRPALEEASARTRGATVRVLVDVDPSSML
ncbi:MAG: primosomal protein N' [Alphaproteobacteria bacterium]